MDELKQTLLTLLGEEEGIGVAEISRRIKNDNTMPAELKQRMDVNRVLVEMMFDGLVIRRRPTDQDGRYEYIARYYLTRKGRRAAVEIEPQEARP